MWVCDRDWLADHQPSLEAEQKVSMKMYHLTIITPNAALVIWKGLAPLFFFSRANSDFHYWEDAESSAIKDITWATLLHDRGQKWTGQEIKFWTKRLRSSVIRCVAALKSYELVNRHHCSSIRLNAHMTHARIDSTAWTPAIQAISSPCISSRAVWRRLNIPTTSHIPQQVRTP